MDYAPERDLLPDLPADGLDQPTDLRAVELQGDLKIDVRLVKGGSKAGPFGSRERASGGRQAVDVPRPAQTDDLVEA
jgi:hypothetical protein